MTLVNISTAARVSGKSRATIQRYLKNGRLSATTDNDGHVKIDVSELLRVFGELVSDGTVAVQELPVSKLHQDTDNFTELRQQLKQSLEREIWLKSQLESALAHNRELDQRILALSEGGTPKKGWWDRLLGR